MTGVAVAQSTGRDGSIGSTFRKKVAVLAAARMGAIALGNRRFMCVRRCAAPADRARAGRHMASVSSVQGHGDTAVTILMRGGILGEPEGPSETARDK